MATAAERDWEIIATRMERVPQALTSFEAALREGLSRGVLAARRQALVCADQGARWSGRKNGSAFFPTLVTKYTGGGATNPALRRRLDAAAAAAAAAYPTATRFLLETDAPNAAARAAGRGGRHVLHAAVGGFHAPGANLVSDPGKDAVPALGRSVDGLSRGRAWAPSSAGASDLPGPRVKSVPARGGVRPRLFRGLGAVRRALDGRARLPAESRLRARHAAGASLSRHAGHRGHRGSPWIDDPFERGLPPGRDLLPRTHAAIRCR